MKTHALEATIEIIATLTMSILALASFAFAVTHNANDNPIASIFALLVWIVSAGILLVMWGGAKQIQAEENMKQNEQ